MNSVSDQIKQAASDRLKSPILGSFLLIWLVVNWQVPTALLTGTDCSTCRIDNVTLLLQNKTRWEILTGPLLWTLGYLTVMQFIVHIYGVIPLWLSMRDKHRELSAQNIKNEISQLGTTKTELLDTFKTELSIIRAQHDNISTLMKQSKPILAIEPHHTMMNNTILKLETSLRSFNPRSGFNLENTIATFNKRQKLLKHFFIAD